MPHLPSPQAEVLAFLSRHVPVHGVVLEQNAEQPVPTPQGWPTLHFVESILLKSLPLKQPARTLTPLLLLKPDPDHSNSQHTVLSKFVDATRCRHMCVCCIYFFFLMLYAPWGQGSWRSRGEEGDGLETDGENFGSVWPRVESPEACWKNLDFLHGPDPKFPRYNKSSSYRQK